MKQLRKIFFSILLVFILTAPIFALSACNEPKFINVTLDYTPTGCGFNGVKENDSDYCTGFTVWFSDDYDDLATTFKFKSGASVDVAPFTRINRNYKVDKIYYLDKNGKEVVLYAYAEGDYEDADFINDTWSANRIHNQWEQYFTLPDYDITIHIVTSPFQNAQ